ncbi:MAG: succinate--CoA ligase subunit alpha [Alphaproteobacteria bacterium]|nr:succinate--CoA ligase subunit alpha [Alphaproteobacteria bacterium]
MSILVNKNTRVLIQGITGLQASFHTKRMMSMGTNVVAGVSTHSAGEYHLGVPIFSNVKEAVKQTKANASLLFVPAKSVKPAIEEALQAGIKLIVSIAYGVPILDVLEIHKMIKAHDAVLIGPNTPGIITPSEACLGVFPENIHQKGHIGIVSRSSTLTYEAVLETNRAGLGQSTVIGIGDDMIAGSHFDKVLELFHQDIETKAIILIGALGGAYEEKAAAYYGTIKNKKPLIAYITGFEDFGDDMGYASDIITHGKVTIQDKKRIFKDAGALVIDSIDDLHETLKYIK